MDFAFTENGKSAPSSRAAPSRPRLGVSAPWRRLARDRSAICAAPSNSITCVLLQSSWRSAAARCPTSCVATIGNNLSAGCKKLRSTPSSRTEGMSIERQSGRDHASHVDCRPANVPKLILHEPAGPQKGSRKTDLLQRLFHQCVPGQQVLVRRICADGRQAGHLAGTSLDQSRRYGGDGLSGLGTAGLRIELRRAAG